MAHDVGYVHEQLYRAVLSLATGHGTPLERLASAFLSHLTVLTPDDFPAVTPDGLAADDRQDFEELLARMTKGGPAGNEAALRAAIMTMSNGDAERLIGNVLCLCPNDHVRFDYGAVTLDDELNVTETATGAADAVQRTAALTRRLSTRAATPLRGSTCAGASDRRGAGRRRRQMPARRGSEQHIAGTPIYSGAVAT